MLKIKFKRTKHMAIFNSFIFDNIDSLSQGVYITGEAVYNAPERAVEMITIPGKNGDLTIDQGRFENIDVKYPAGCFAKTQSEFAEKIRNIRNVLASRYNYVRLEDTYNPDEFRLALYKSGVEVDPVEYSRAGKFDIVFNCKPQRFLKSGEVPYDFVTSYDGLTDENSVQLQNENGVDIEGGVGFSNNIVNPTDFEAKPLIHAKGNGIVNLGSQRITIEGLPSNNTDIYIDCEAMEIYTKNGSVISSASSYVTFNTANFPVIPKGTSGFTYTMDIADIIPRWWRI